MFYRSIKQATIQPKEICFKSLKEKHNSLEEVETKKEEMIKIIIKTQIKFLSIKKFN
jgi:hypothetical protein